MTHYGLPFKPYMVRALLDGTKTCTRRFATRVNPGDDIWVRETWRTHADVDGFSPSELDQVLCDTDTGTPDLPSIEWLADVERGRGLHLARPGRWRAGIHLPRRFARLHCQVTEVARERLGDIGPRDAIAEGLTHDGAQWGVDALPETLSRDPREAFARLWDAVNGPGAWRRDRKREVVVIRFRRVG